MQTKKRESKTAITFQNWLHRVTGWPLSRCRKIYGRKDEVVYLAVQGAIIAGFWLTEQISTADIFIITGISSAILLNNILVDKNK